MSLKGVGARVSDFELLPPADMSHMISTREGPLHFQDVGTGQPVLFIHSFGPQPGVTAWMIFHRVLREISRSRRCIALDMPNFGLSGPIVYDEPFHDVVVRSVLSLMDHLDLDEVPVVGTSMGATVALDLAITAPHRVSGLVVGSCHASTGGDPYLLGPFPSEVQRLYDEAQLHPTDLTHTVRLLKALVYDETVVTEAMVSAIQAFRDSRLGHWRAVSQSTSRAHSNLSALSSIGIPMRIIHGRFDRMVPFEQALMLMSYVRHADVTLLNQCGHWPAFERPVAFSSIVEEWLDSNHW